MVTQSHWPLLRNRASLRDSERASLDEVLAADPSLLAVYVMDEQLKSLWHSPYPRQRRGLWEDWLTQAYDDQRRQWAMAVVYCRNVSLEVGRQSGLSVGYAGNES